MASPYDRNEAEVRRNLPEPGGGVCPKTGRPPRRVKESRSVKSAWDTQPWGDLEEESIILSGATSPIPNRGFSA
jgi:hypothetical protein